MDFKPRSIFFHSKLQHLFKLPTNCVHFTILTGTLLYFEISTSITLCFFLRKALLKKNKRLNFLKLLSSLNSKEKEKKKLLSRDKKNIATKRHLKSKVSVKFLVTTILNFCPTCLFINIDHMSRKHWKCSNFFLCLQFGTKFLGTLTMKESTHNFPKFFYMAFFFTVENHNCILCVTKNSWLLYLRSNFRSAWLWLTNCFTYYSLQSPERKSLEFRAFLKYVFIIFCVI